MTTLLRLPISSGESLLALVALSCALGHLASWSTKDSDLHMKVYITLGLLPFIDLLLVVGIPGCLDD